MKITRIAFGVVLTCVTLLHATARASVSDGGMTYVKTNVGPGVWINSHFVELKAQAEAKNLPLIVFWANPGCNYCKQLEAALATGQAVAWQKKSGYLLAFGYGTSTADDSKAKSFAMHSGGKFPFLCFYWKKNAQGKTVNAKYCGRFGSMLVKAGTLFDQFKGTAQTHFAGYASPTTFNGGAFAVREEAGNRYEAEASTTNVVVGLVRTADEAKNEETAMLVIRRPSGTSTTNLLAWTAGESARSINVALPQGTFSQAGEQIALSLLDADGVVYDETHITYVEREVSAANPLWIGEKFGFGEWTCDLDAAKDLVAKTDAAAYTLVSIQGSMWCPDCANTDRNFLDAQDASGANRFQAWAKAKNIALVSMDIPNYKGASVTNFASPTLFATNAYATTLARAKEYPQSGADAALTNAAVRSGLGYLTRKGATPEQAAAQLVKFHDLACKNTDAGGFHRPEDGNPNRTGVPIFVLLRQDGSLAARFTRFASVSPMAANQADFDNYIKRFEEMLAIAGSGEHADVAEIENNYPGDGAVAFAANGGTASGELCNADMQDAFKLAGVAGNAEEQVTVKGTTAAEVSVQFWKRNADGSFGTVGSSATGLLSDGVQLTQTFSGSGDYYLLVKGKDITSEAFDAASAAEAHFHGYTVSGATVLVPQDDPVKANAPADSDKVVIRLEKDQVYCFAGVSAQDNPCFEQMGTLGAYAILKATESGDVTVKIATGLGGEISYQLWRPGQVAFAEAATNVVESVNSLNDDFVEFQVSRIGGKSGRVKARVTVDAAASTLDENRYAFATNAPNGAVDLLWEDGVSSNMTLRVHIEDDLYCDADQKLVFNVEVLACDAGDVTVAAGRGTYTMTILEDDKSAPGRGQITRTEPNYAKKGTVYVRESEGAKIWVARIEAYDGLVAAEIASSVAGLTFTTENPRDLEVENGKTLLRWASREQGEKYVQVKGLAAGKTTKIQFKSHESFKTVNGSNTVSVVAVADDAPGFADAEKTFAVNRYVAVSDSSVAADAFTLTGGPVTFSKLEGSIPAGLSAAWDDARKALIFTGAPTGKAGTYTATYQIVEKRDGRNVKGLTTRVTFSLTDPTDVKNNPDANPAVSTARTFKSLPIMFGTRLAGLLQLTIPSSGKLSAKYTCATGAVSFTSKSWSGFDALDRTLSADMACKYEGYAMHVDALANGFVKVALTDPACGKETTVEVDWAAWSKSNPATDWAGYYTVAYPLADSSVQENVANLAPRGTGWLTLKMNTSSAVNSGTVSWAGMLPNGTTLSGSASLAGQVADEEGDWARLPVFSRISTDVFASYVRILAKAQTNDERRCVLAAKNDSDEEVVAAWTHVEKVANGCYSANLETSGSYYNAREDLGSCCREYFQKDELSLVMTTEDLAWLSAGTPGEIGAVDVKVEASTMKIVSGQENPSSVTLSFNHNTGVVTGRAKLAYQTEAGDARTMYVNYKGVVLNGWGEGCGCGDYTVFRPFVNGAFYFADKLSYESQGRARTLNVKRGGNVSLALPEL